MPPQKNPLLSLDLSNKEHTQLQLSKLVSTVITRFYPLDVIPDRDQVCRVRVFYLEIMKVLHERIAVHTTLYALLYVQRLVSALNIRIHPDAAFGVLTIAFHLADHTSNDEVVPLRHWAKLTRIDNQSLVKMKREFLSSIQFNLMVGPDEYTEWIQIVSALMNYSPSSPVSPTMKKPESMAEPMGFNSIPIL
ncbi:MAG: hypothetical protein SGCHY_003954 [Lobulomycetales sp.]